MKRKYKEIGKKFMIGFIACLVISENNVYAQDQDQLTKTELELYAKHPLEAYKAKQCAIQARKAAKKYFAEYTLEQGNGDAFRHAYWSALMTKKIGADFAYQAGLAHENVLKGYDFSKLSDDSKMDISNNFRGRKYGKKYANKSDKYLLRVVKKACTKGRLKRIRVKTEGKEWSDKTIANVKTTYKGYYVKSNSEGLK